MKVLGLIPARGGSKGVPGKNIKPLNGKPLLAYAIESAKAANSLTHFVVSTDDPAIKAVAEAHGADVPFLRPAALAQDSSSDFDVIKHAIEWFAGKQEFDAIAYLRPTTPLRTSGDIDQAIAELNKSKLGVVRSITQVDAKSHPYWMFRKEGTTASNFVDGISLNNYFQRQLLPPCYRINGVVDVIRIDRLLQLKTLAVDQFTTLDIPAERGHDIDTQNDFEFLETLMKRKKANA